MCESIMDKVKNLGFGGASGLARTEFAQIAISTPGMPPSATGLGRYFDGSTRLHVSDGLGPWIETKQKREVNMQRFPNRQTR
jgi:hypothetical protein